jgi:pyrroloquinoline quinone (PQQ) biosynthesis protein C
MAEDSLKVIQNQDQAVAEYTGERFFDWLWQEVTTIFAQSHELSNILSEHSKQERFKKFLLQRYLSEMAFYGKQEGDPGFLSFVHANLSESNDPLAESALSQVSQRMTSTDKHLVAKTGLSYSHHKELWLRLFKALQMPEEEIHHAEPKEACRSFIAETSDILSNSAWQTALGYLVSLEAARTAENSALAGLIGLNLGVSEQDLEILRRSDRVFCMNLLEKVSFDIESKELVWQGVLKQMEIRKNFLNGLGLYLKV